jgi:hypothetical protein
MMRIARAAIALTAIAGFVPVFGQSMPVPGERPKVEVPKAGEPTADAPKADLPRAEPPAPEAEGIEASRTVQEGIDTSKAVQAAIAWAELVDNERYGDSFDAAAAMVRQSVPRLKWETSIQEARRVLGSFGGRKVRSLNYTRTMPGVPEGDYVVIEFQSLFANSPLTVEVIVPMRDRDGNWRVAGYAIR